MTYNCVCKEKNMVWDGNSGTLYSLNEDDIALLNRLGDEFWDAIGCIKKINYGALSPFGNNTFMKIKGTLYLPDSVEHIGRGAFCGQDKVKTIILPENLKYIEEDAFLNCSSLETIEIPEKVEFIGDNAFFGCEDLRRVLFKSYKGVSKNAFAGCNIKKIEMSKKALNQMVNKEMNTDAEVTYSFRDIERTR